MARPVLVVGLDALSPSLLEQWMDHGELPVLAALARQGTYARQRNYSFYRTENSWLTLLHGCSPEISHEWGHQAYDAGSYRVIEWASYAFRKFPPFYALGDRKRVAVFDVPLTGLVDDVDGIQLLGWGTEVNQILRQSSPADLMAEMISRHGRHPLYDTITNADDGSETLSYRIPSIYDVHRLRRVRDQLLSAVRQRTAILREILRRDCWDLVFCAYGEIHTAGHLFWHVGRQHPIAEALLRQAGSDFMLDVMKGIDRALADLMDDVSGETDVYVLSPHGMQGNSLDLYSMVFLPELLYRWSSGKMAFKGARAGSALLPPRLDYSRHWRDEIWDLRTHHGEQVLESPLSQEARGDPLDWDPGNWYRPLWPKMRAFSLPGYSEGLVRLNVVGRDGPGGIAPGDFATTCDELTAIIDALTDARSGERMVERIVRVRNQPGLNSSTASSADLMVVWREGLVTDVVEHPHFGQIGPVPFFRTGGHATEGFVLARGAEFAPGERRAAVQTADVTATILHSMDISPPAHAQGTPMQTVVLRNGE